MRLNRVYIKNYKSLVDFKLEDLKPFCAFVGPNASGKSNIFESLEFANHVIKYSFDAPSFFGGKDLIFSYNPTIVAENSNFKEGQLFTFEFGDGIKIDMILSYEQRKTNSNYPITSIGTRANTILNVEQLSALEIRNTESRNKYLGKLKEEGFKYENDYEHFVDNFARIFVGNPNLIRRYGSPQVFSSTLLSDASNLTQILGTIFENENKREEFIEWLHILIPEFKSIDVKKSNLDGRYEFYLYEKSSDKPFPRYLISDGTYNILALMAAVYQSSQPQFLCIEEPENGLHPQAIQSLIDFFRQKSEEEGHFIWLNTHSQTLVRCLAIDELVLVNKINGETKAKQMTKEDKIDINSDEAWLSNALGGGTLWSR